MRTAPATASSAAATGLSALTHSNVDSAMTCMSPEKSLALGADACNAAASTRVSWNMKSSGNRSGFRHYLTVLPSLRSQLVISQGDPTRQAERFGALEVSGQ